MKCFDVGFSSDSTEPIYMNLRNILRYVTVSRDLCRDISEGKAEEALRFFDADNMDNIFGNSQT